MHGLRRTYSALLIIATLTLFTLAACTKRDQVKKLPLHEVVVIHSWDSIGEEKERFPELMENEFLRHSINANVHHFYCNMAHRSPRVFAAEDWDALADSIKKIKPEIILLNDDPIMEFVLGGYMKDDSLIRNTPCVYSGVTTLLKDSLKNFDLMTGFEEKIDLAKNLEVVNQVTGNTIVVIELDDDSLNQRIRRQLEVELADTVKYENNSNFHVEHLSRQWTDSLYPGKMIVNFFSAGSPYKNHRMDESSELGKQAIQQSYRHARETPQLQVKYDIFSNDIIDRSRTPQFTCIREQFNNKNRIRFLAGYFTSIDIQVEDQVYYASRIINGEHPKMLSRSTHHAGYFMDWNAMKMLNPPLSYSEYANGENKIAYTIVNAPMELEDPLSLALLIIAGLVVAYVAVKFLVYYLSGWKKKGQQKLLEEKTYEEKIHELVFASSNDTLWHISNDAISLSDNFVQYYGIAHHTIALPVFRAQYVHEDSQVSFDVLSTFRQQRGKKTLRLRLTYDGGETWHWVELTYTATEESARTGELYGLLLNIDRMKETEEELERAQVLASEVALKENFLANISHDLRTPLGAVTGFPSLLTMPGMELSDEERAEYGTIIHQNTDMILNMIDSVMQKAQIETGDLEILQKPVEMSKLINETFQTNRIIAPTHLQFTLETDEPDCMLNIDLTRTKQVVNNFLSNSFKFTAEGKVTLGWRHIDDQQVEVYVLDTGIGVKKEALEHLFDRYVKVNETDKGTGLGLNISKTIIEKQGGTIGAESEFGKGSKFFFRLTKFVQCLLLVITMGLGIASMTSCNKYQQSSTLKANVVLIHGYDKEYPPYRQFNEDVHHALLSNGIDPTIRHIYLDLDNPRMDDKKEYFRICDSLKKSGWEADIFLTEGDRAAHFLLSIDSTLISNKSKELPIVLGSLHHPEWDKLREHKNMVAISDPIDYIRNINLARDISKQNVIEIELDHFHQDSLIRSELQQVLASPQYVDNSDFHIKNVKSELLRTQYKDSIVVLVYSAESPELNSDSIISEEEGYARLGQIFTHSWQYASLAVKKDMYSAAIVDKTGKPQFTAVKAGFGDGEARYLCGYFADYHTVAKDIANAGAKILKGTAPRDLVGLTHEKQLFMDFSAMEAWGLKYDDYKDQFVIINAPLNETAPLAYYGTILLVCVVLIGGLLAVVLIAQSWRENSINDLIANVKRRASMRQLALHGADSRSVRNEDNVKEIISHIHPDHSSDIPLMMQSIDVAGTHSYDIYADIDEEGNYHWWQLRFVVMFDYHDHKVKHKHNVENKRVDGILINIDEAMNRENDLRNAMILAEEAKQKEDFLTTISHEIRTPLNAVVGFSDVMVSLPKDSLTDEDLISYGKIIKTSNATLTSMIEDILMFSRIESGRIKYMNNEFKIIDLIEELRAEWTDLIPENLKFNVFCFNPLIVMNGDRQRIKYILNQMISNAVKFSTHGAVILGVAYHLNTDEAEFFVGDCGCGIPKEKHDMVYNLFWKDNEFIPGLGLGLHVCKKLADGMGLRLDLESKVGYGSKFSLYGKAEIKQPIQ